MYNLPEYKEQDPAKVRAFMLSNPFILLCGVDDKSMPVATHVPVLVRQDKSGQDYLLGHIMKGTDHHKAFMKNTAVLAIFNGPHSYVSASWYKNKAQGSTWNYMTVHARGKLSFLGHEDLIEILKETTAHFEADPASPSLFHHLPEDYVDRLSKAIVGFRIDIQELQHVFKLSQNRDEESYQEITERLDNGDAHAKQIAREMSARYREQYPGEPGADT